MINVGLTNQYILFKIIIQNKDITIDYLTTQRQELTITNLNKHVEILIDI